MIEKRLCRFGDAGEVRRNGMSNTLKTKQLPVSTPANTRGPSMMFLLCYKCVLRAKQKSRGAYKKVPIQKGRAQNQKGPLGRSADGKEPAPHHRYWPN